jgi:hypothetical protein
MKYVAAVLDFDINNPEKVMVSVDPNVDIDLTLIIGKDYLSISSIQSYLNN